jgi:hypothetical protein
MAAVLSVSVDANEPKSAGKDVTKTKTLANQNINQLLSVIANIRRSFLVEQPQLLPVVAQSLIEAENIIFQMSDLS